MVVKFNHCSITKSKYKLGIFDLIVNYQDIIYFTQIRKQYRRNQKHCAQSKKMRPQENSKTHYIASKLLLLN